MIPSNKLNQSLDLLGGDDSATQACDWVRTIFPFFAVRAVHYVTAAHRAAVVFKRVCKKREVITQSPPLFVIFRMFMLRFCAFINPDLLVGNSNFIFAFSHLSSCTRVVPLNMIFTKVGQE